VGQDRVVGIATSSGLDGPGIIFRWVWDFLGPSRLALWLTRHLLPWVPDFFPRHKSERRGVDYPPTSNAEFEELVELVELYHYPIPPLCFSFTL
jgi:hypothetical protein